MIIDLDSIRFTDLRNLGHMTVPPTYNTGISPNTRFGLKVRHWQEITRAEVFGFCASDSAGAKVRAKLMHVRLQSIIFNAAYGLLDVFI